VAFLETFAAEDAFEGDHDGFQARPARWYRRTLARHGLQPVGSHAGSAPPWRAMRPRWNGCESGFIIFSQLNLRDTRMGYAARQHMTIHIRSSCSINCTN
jgi:hypothetical protein